MSAEPVTDSISHHGECPFWDAATEQLLFSDVLAGEIVALDASMEVSRHKVPSRAVTVIRRRSSGGFAVVSEHDLLGADEKLSQFDSIASICNDPTVRTNEGGCDPLGGLIVGTMAYDERAGAGTVYRIGVDHTVAELVPSVSISNGVQWSASGDQVYYVDTPTRRIDKFNVDRTTGEWTARRHHIELDGIAGYPDGMAIDDEDGLWIALWGAGSVIHYDASGRRVETIKVPEVSQPTSCTFGGTHRDVLFITTSRQNMRQDEEPLAGAIFAIGTGYRGAPQHEYQG